ncbi:MAG: AgmX/PglI C-terminal domain-containing protein [Myxococcota bacterium]|jgi:peroxiredoxin
MRLCALVLALSAVLAAVPATAHALTIGDPAPQFEMERTSGEFSVKLGDFRGKTVLLTVWASWCGVCRKQIPEMIRLQKELGPKGLAVVAVSRDEMKDIAKRYLDGVERDYEMINFTSLFDRFSIMDNLYPLGGSVPVNFIIDKNGNIVQIIRGGFDSKSVAGIRKMLLAVIAGKSPGSVQLGGDPDTAPQQKNRAKNELRIDETRVLVSGGTLDRSAVASVLQGGAGWIPGCYERERDKKPALRGEILVRFVVAPEGKVSGAFIEQSYMDNETVESCVKEEILKLRFPSPKGGESTIRYPFVFRAE